MKKTITIILFAVLMLMCCITFVGASENNGLSPTGLLPEDWESMINSEHESTLYGLATVRKGDTNRDGLVTSADARECLQIVAGLNSDLSMKSDNATDVNNDYIITATDARLILQEVVGLREIETAAETTLGDGFVVGPLQSSATPYHWECEFDENNLDILHRTFDDNSQGVVGGDVNNYFAFTPKNTGTYIITFKLVNVADRTDVIDEFKCVFTVKDN